MPREPGVNQDLCADMQGFSLHATARCVTDDRKALADERVPSKAARQVVWKLKTPGNDGTTQR